jgi:hypothetical protein
LVSVRDKWNKEAEKGKERKKKEKNWKWIRLSMRQNPKQSKKKIIGIKTGREVAKNK